MKRFILMFFGMLLLFSCDLTINKDITSQYLVDGLAGGNLDLYLQGTQIFRYKGKPGIVTIPVGNADLSEYESCFVLHVETGTTQETTVSSATIKLDGLEVLNSSDFSKNVGRQYTFEVCDLTPTSVLTVEIAGKPGSYLNIWIEGKLANRGTFTDDRDGKVYKWVKIGNQIWMAENLAYLPAVYPPSDYSLNDLRYYVYHFYGTDKDQAKQTDNYKKWGVLYNVPSAMLEGTCPAGWHIPADAEWHQLMQFISQDNQECPFIGFNNENCPYHCNPNIPGDLNSGGFWSGISPHLKTKTGWPIYDPPIDYYNIKLTGTDTYGFSAVPSGFIIYSPDAIPPNSADNFGNIQAAYWSSSSSLGSTGYAFHQWRLPDGESTVQWYCDNPNANAFSIRCVKDN